MNDKEASPHSRQQEYFFILVEPVYKGNIGAAARVMKNFGFTNLRIVGSMPTKEDYYLAVHSQQIIENAQTCRSLQEAVEDMDNVIAFSRRYGRKKPVDIAIKELGSFTEKLARGKTALVFGRETYGLTDEEAELCPLRCHIPADDNFPSLNLAQAVAVTAYELFTSLQVSNTVKVELAPKEKVSEACKTIVNYLQEMDYFRTGVQEKTKNKLGNILMKSYVTQENLRFLVRMFHRIMVLYKKKTD